MDRKSIITVVLIVFGMVGALGLAAYYSGRQDARPVGALDSSARFKAKPGATRDNAAALSSAKRQGATSRGGGGGSGDALVGEGTGETPEGGGSASENSVVPVKSLSPAEAAPGSEPIKQVVREALNAASPEMGIQKIEAALADNPSDDDRALMENAAGVLYCQLRPPVLDAAGEAFDAAYLRASTPGLRIALAVDEIATWLRLGETQRAGARLQQALGEPPVPGAARARLGLLQGQFEEAQGNAAGAEGAYRQVLSEGAEAASPEPGLQDAARVAGLRLTRLLRKEGRQEEAQAVAGDFSSVDGGVSAE